MIGRWWHPTLWRLPGLQDLPDEERIAMLEGARAATPWRHYVMITVILVWIIAIGVLAFYLHDRPRWPSPAPWLMLTLIPVPLWARLWRERAVERVVRERLRHMRDEEIESIIATH